MTQVVCAANLLRQAERCAHQHGTRKPAPSGSRQHMPESKETAEKGKSCRGMASGKTAASATVAYAPCPM